MADANIKVEAAFGNGRKFFHWAIVLFLLFQIPLGLYMTGLADGPEKIEKYSLHQACGILIFALGVSRLFWALISKRPPLPEETPLYEKVLVKLLQAILYIVICLMPLSGWMMSSAGGYPINMFGLFSLPALIEPNKDLVEGFVRMHEMQSWILFGAIGLHFSGALRHHFLLKDKILVNMLPIKKQ
jgi:cytochrome b561